MKWRTSDGRLLLHKILLRWRLPIRHDGFVEAIEQQPYTYSLESLSSALHTLRIPNLIVSLPCEKLRSLRFPVITHLCVENLNKIVIVESQIEKSCSVVGHDTALELKELYRLCKGQFLMVDPLNKASLFAYARNLVFYALEQQRLMLFMLFVFAAYLAARLANADSLLSAILLIKAIGAFLFWHVFRRNTSPDLFEKFCKVNSKLRCLKLFDTRIGSVLSHLGLFYFAITLGAALPMVYLFSLGELMEVYFFLSVCCIPVLLYSIYLQLFKFRTVCFVCMFTILLLLCEFCMLNARIEHIGVVQWDVYLSFMLFAGLIGGIVYLKVRQIQLREYLNGVKVELNGIKRKSTFWRDVFNSAPHLEMHQFEHEIQFGSDNAELKAVVVLSPSCFTCLQLVKWMRYFIPTLTNAQVRLRFVVSKNDPHALHSVHRLYDAYLHGNFETAYSALLSFIGSTNLKSSEEGYHRLTTSYDLTRTIERHEEWFKQSGLQWTPCIIIDNKLMPKTLSFDDIGFILRHGI